MMTKWFCWCAFLLSTRSSSSVLMNLMMSDENNRDIYITIASMPPPKPCSHCCPVPSASTIRTGKQTHTQRDPPLPCSHYLRLSLNRLYHFYSTGSGECLEHGYVLNSRYQVVYPFPTFQPAFQLKKDQVILLNTSYSLVACGISLCPGKTRTEILEFHCSSLFNNTLDKVMCGFKITTGLWARAIAQFPSQKCAVPITSHFKTPRWRRWKCSLPVSDVMLAAALLFTFYLHDECSACANKVNKTHLNSIHTNTAKEGLFLLSGSLHQFINMCVVCVCVYCKDPYAVHIQHSCS